MVEIADLIKVSDYIYEIPQTFRSDMRVPARFFTDEQLLKGIMGDRSLEQLVNTATLPGVVKYALAMPDIHQGYGFPIGGVVATQLPDGVISPGGVGYDINCGVRLLGTKIGSDQLAPHIELLTATLYNNCPSGVGKGGYVKLTRGELTRLVELGSRWALKKGFATEEDLEKTEEGGCLEGADAGTVSQRAFERGMGQLGTLGAGNHFIEIDVVNHVFDDKTAERIGLFQGQIVVQIHCGSRGFGHQICTDYVKAFQKCIKKYGLKLADRELVCAPLSSPEGENYLSAMKAAANYAYANRQVLTQHIRRSFDHALAGKIKNRHVYQIYDIAHNMAKIEQHQVDGKDVKLCVHRKGATRAFGPSRPEIPAVYRDVGQPVLVPGSMGTSSWVLVGTQSAMEQTFGSTCHGAGRMLSRTQAKKNVRGTNLLEQLKAEGIYVLAGSMAGLAEEAPAAYKDVNRVVEVVHGAGIATKVARLYPLAVIKG
ncbi:MAG: RtcB family protein [Desulfobacterales bacterium]